MRTDAPERRVGGHLLEWEVAVCPLALGLSLDAQTPGLTPGFRRKVSRQISPPSWVPNRSLHRDPPCLHVPLEHGVGSGPSHVDKVLTFLTYPSRRVFVTFGLAATRPCIAGREDLQAPTLLTIPRGTYPAIGRCQSWVGASPTRRSVTLPGAVAGCDGTGATGGTRRPAAMSATSS